MKKNLLNKTVVVLLLVLILGSFTETNAQCAMCRAVLENSEDASVAEAVNDGIVYLMIIPYLLVAGVIFYIYRKWRK
jgi:hypothetical protein